MEQTAEQVLVERAKSDAGALGELYDSQYPKILNYVVRRVGDLAIAEDITAETFIKAFDHLHTFQWRGLPFSAWLYRIASNEIATYFRKKHTKDVSLDELMDGHKFEPPSDTDIEAAYIEAQEAMLRHRQFAAVQKVMQTLPQKYQEALALRYLEKKSIEEIGQIMGKRPGTIKSLLSRGVKKVRSQVQPFFDNDVITSGDKKS